MPGWSIENVERAERMWNDGDSASVIGEAIGVSKNAIISLAHRKGWRARRMGVPGGGRRKPRVDRRGAVISGNRNGALASKVLHAIKRPPELKQRPVKEPPPPPTARMISLMDLGQHDCKWPIGNGKPWLFCGAPKDMALPYCPFHQVKAWRCAG